MGLSSQPLDKWGAVQRPASFSIAYVLYRSAQHRVPGSSIGQRLTSWFGIGDLTIPIPLGELYGVWRC